MPTNSVIRVVLVEKEALVRTALQKLVESWAGLEVVAQAENLDEIWDVVGDLKPELVLLSVSGEEDFDADTARALMETNPETYLLVLIGECELRCRLEIVRLGARGVVQKKRAADELQRAIRKVCEGQEIWLDRAALTSLIAPPREELSAGDMREGNLAALTGREQEVVALVTKGFKNKEVGARLFISETTVRHHLTTIFNKLKLSGRFELIAYVHQHRLPELQSIPAPPQGTPRPGRRE